MTNFKPEKKNQALGLTRQRRLRALIIQVLYGNEFELQNFKNFKKSDLFSKRELSFFEDTFIQERVKKIQDCQEKLDEIISSLSKNWKKERMSLIDLNIMRLAVFEILFCEETPDKVALNEAIELSKTFGDDNSSNFVNGILDQVMQNKKT